MLYLPSKLDKIKSKFGSIEFLGIGEGVDVAYGSIASSSETDPKELLFEAINTVSERYSSVGLPTDFYDLYDLSNS